WKGVRRLASEWQAQGVQIGRPKVADLLPDVGSRLQAHRKRREGSQDPDRDAQVEHRAAEGRPVRLDTRPSFREPPKRKSGSETSRTTGGKGVRKGARSPCAFTTWPIKSGAKRSPTAVPI